jgi:hypothetical protein
METTPKQVMFGPLRKTATGRIEKLELRDRAEGSVG